MIVETHKDKWIKHHRKLITNDFSIKRGYCSQIEWTDVW